MLRGFSKGNARVAGIPQKEGQFPPPPLDLSNGMDFDQLTSLFYEHQYCYTYIRVFSFCSKPEKALCDLMIWSKS